MRLVHVIVSDGETGVVSIDSFGIVDEQLSDEVNDEAEELYRTKAGELEFGNDGGDAEDEYFAEFTEKVNQSMRNGYITINGVTLSIVWSTIENIQD